jgi:hypothetical protein
METKIYSFNELSDKAKLRALTDYQSDAEYYWGYDALTSLKEFMNEVGVNLISYDIDWLNPWRSHVHYEGKPHGQFIKEDLTGFCMDYPLTNTWNKTKSISACIDAFLKDCANDYEYQLSEDGYNEHCNGNEIKFYEDGRIFIES